MIITCPNCLTKYQVAQKTIGSAGRKVLCASCNQSWKALAEQSKESLPKPKLVKNNDDKLFDEKDEEKLDGDFESQEKLAQEELTQKKTNAIEQNNRREEDKDINKEQEKTPSNSTQSRQQEEMQKRQIARGKKFPLWRIKQNSRYFAFFILLAIIIGGFAFRTPIVRLVPQFAPVYEAFGLKINIFGLDFKDVKTLRTHNNGVDKMLISAKISNITNKQLNMPMVVVTILGENDASLLQWNVSPIVSKINAGETINFETQLNLTPIGSKEVNLSFSNEWND